MIVNLAVLPKGQKFSGHNILIVFYQEKEKQLYSITIYKTGMKCFQDVGLLSYELL